MAAAYTVLFSVFMTRASEEMGKIQWLCEDGVWALFFYLILCFIAVRKRQRTDFQWLWAPNERSLAYAYHVQVATDERTENELIPVQDELIQGGEEEAGVMVSPIQGGVESLKPMKM